MRPHLLDRLRRSHGRGAASRDLAHVTAPVPRGDTDADAPVQPAIIALAFATPHAARDALDTAHALAAGGELAVHDAVLFSRATDAPADVYETRDPTPAETAVPTGMLGAVVGTLVAGPLGLVIGAAVGAGGGALAAKLIDTGIPDEVVIQIREMTAPGEYVLAVLVDHIHGAAVIDALRRFRGARVVFSTLPSAASDLVRRTLTPTRTHARA